MINSTLTKDQLIELKSEFVDWKIDEMTREEMADYVRSMMLLEIDPDPEILKDTINGYDENLYDLLLQYVKGVDGSWEELQEYKRELHEHDWINDC